MLKQLFDISEKKGNQNELITLSKNYGNTQSIISSGVERSINGFIGENKNNDLSVQEYLANISNKTMPPNTFNMRQLLEQLPENNLNFENLEYFWNNSLNISNSNYLANDWTRQFNEENELNNKWMEEFILEQKNLKMENDWGKINEGSVWAKDFLENYDLNGKQLNNWENEFLNDFGKEEKIEFFDYENPKAICALRNALKLNPKYLKAILALSVSLANEGFDCLALHELDKFICIYKNCSEEEMPKGEGNTSFGFQYKKLDKNEFLKVEAKFLEVIKFVQPEYESILYNLSNDYNKAIECLNSALNFKPEVKDPILWNRLGATLANADRSAEAINAYKRALQISPSYVRVRYNLGVSCMNLQSFREAAIHFLAALKIQHSPEQSLIWSRLRSAIIRMENIQLDNEIFEAINCRDLDRISKIFGV
uniref:Peroxin-5 n=1 Tax=Meloidogyne javanica TaxID=6303 RepID=A0A915LWV3_MELJA